MKKSIKLYGIILAITLVSNVYAQNTWNWGTQIDEAKEKNVLYTDALKIKNYEATKEPLDWLLTNTPDLNPSIYINGVKIYENLAKKETDATKKEAYIQKGLELHDLRITYFPKSKNNVVERKARFGYLFYNKNKDKYEELFSYFQKAFEIKQSKLSMGSLVAYMNMTYKNYLYKKITETQVIDIYSAISEALDEQKKSVSEAERKKINKSADTIDRLLTATKVEISCDFVKEKLGPKLNQGKDVNMAKQIFRLMLKGKCLDNPLVLKAASIIQKDEPTYGVAKFLAQKNAQKQNDTKAIEYFKEATSLTNNTTEKAEMYIEITKIHIKNEQKSIARNTARRALSFDPTYADAYEKIGDLYFSSYGSGPCYQEQSQIEDRLVFIAAYEQYKKAGNTVKMAAAKAQFPSIENIFNEGKEEGQSLTIGCWINTTVKLERRPAN